MASLAAGARAASALPTESLAADEPAIVALVNRAVRRDQRAFAELYDCFLQRVYQYIYYRTGNRADTEDLTEQVFLRAWAAIDRFRWHGKPFRAWLYTLAHNAVVDYRRRAHATQSLDDDRQAFNIESPAAAQELTGWMDAELLAAAISQLTPEQQQVIVLKFVEGLETAEVAQLIDKREGTVRALQMRALQSLRRLLERQGERDLT